MARPIPPSRAGYEPGLGQPDPEDRTQVPVQKAHITHYADGGRNGPVCGLRPPPNDASAYDPSDPTCPACLDWLTKTRAHTAKKHGSTIAANEAKAAAATAMTTPPAVPPAQPRQRPTPKPTGDDER